MIKKVPEKKSKYKSNLTFNEGSIEIFSFTSTQKHLSETYCRLNYKINNKICYK